MKSHGFKTVALGDIIVGDRMREDYGDVEELMKSIDENILMHPLVVDPDLNLIAGGRRYKALELQGAKDMTPIQVNVHIIECENEMEFKTLELEENLARKAMDWQEVVKGRKELNDLKQKIHGHGGKGSSQQVQTVTDAKTGEQKEVVGGWLVKDTAEVLGISERQLHNNLRIAKYLEDPKYAERVGAAVNPAHAIKIILQIREEELTAELVLRRAARKESMDEEAVEDSIKSSFLIGNSIQLMKECIPDNSYDMILTDPPYGIDIDDKTKQWDPTGGDTHYDDSHENFVTLITAALPEMYRVLRDDSWCLMFFAIENYQFIRDLAENTGFTVLHKPFIWAKTVPSSTNVPEFRLGSQYECCFMLRKGKPQLQLQGKGDVKMLSGLSGVHKTHPAQKPTELFEYLVELCTPIGAKVLDPFAGSGTTGKACVNLGRDWMCIELDPVNAASAISEIRDIILGDEPEPEVEESTPVAVNFFGQVKDLGDEKTHDYYMWGDGGASQIHEGMLFVEKFVQLFSFKHKRHPDMKELDDWYLRRATDPQGLVFDPLNPEDEVQVRAYMKEEHDDTNI